MRHNQRPARAKLRIARVHRESCCEIRLERAHGQTASRARTRHRMQPLREWSSELDLECGGEFVKLRLKSEADIDRPVPAHSATGRLVGEHAVAVVLNIWYVVEGAEQRAGIKNGDDAVRTVRAAILYDAGFHGGDTAVGLNCGFQID